jgi:hypothetical protein
MRSVNYHPYLYCLIFAHFFSYPLIITIELHCSADQQKVMAILIKKYIGEYLYIGNYDTSQKYPTLNDLKRKIIIRSQMPKVQKNELANVVVRDVQDKIESLKKFDEFNEIRELVNTNLKLLMVLKEYIKYKFCMFSA